MANGSKTFVSPGVYTSEKDLTFVAQSVGVTTLGMVGEALKGPAFEPIFIQSYDDFITRFGGTSPQTYVDSQIPKYELGYIAKAYLSQSNQLFVTRVLGLSGYDAGPSWSIETIGSLDPVSFNSIAVSGSPSGGVNSTYTGATVQTGLTLTFYVPLTGTSNASTSAIFTDSTFSASFFTTLPQAIQNSLYETISLTNGTTLPTLNEDFTTTVIPGIMCNNPFTSSTGGVHGCSGTGLDTVYQYGYIPQYLTSHATALTAAWNVTTLPAVDNRLSTQWNAISSFDYRNDAWYYGMFDYVGAAGCCSGGTYTGASYQVYLDAAATGDSGGTGTTDAGVLVYSGQVIVDVISWSGTNAPSPYTDYDNLTVATLRSRGLSTKTSGGPVYEISGDTVSFDCSGTYGDVLENPFASFGISATTVAGNVYTFKTSMSNTSQEYVSRVFGRSPFDKKKEDVPLFIEESYPNMLKNGYNLGKIRGLRCCFNYKPSARNTVNTNTIAWNMHEWETPETPWIVSELQGSDVFRLFKFISISDGTSANREVKLSITNISFERGEFDILVREFYDSDSSPQVLEKFTRCSLSPTKTSFVGRKVGTSTGEFELKSKYVMVQLGEGVLDGTFNASVPAGFEGYRFRSYGSCNRSPYLAYKTKYYQPGDTIYNPPFGAGNTDNATISGGDKLSKVYLGVSDSIGAGYDADFFDSKGYVVPANVCTATVGGTWSTITKGFHMDSGATVVIGGQGTYLDWAGTSLDGQSIFDVGAAPFHEEPTLSTDPYKKIRSRKFTVAPHGGFDGWDIYRKTRSNTDDYRMGLTGFLNGACVTTEFPTAVGAGTFKKLSLTEASTDYFAFLRGVNTFSNPEAVDINVFATPGIDYVDNLGLVNEAIDMVENDRADSLYITTTPDYNMFVATSTNPLNQITPEEAVDNIEDSSIDSNYTATYYPWIQIKDTANNKQIFVPPTSEVMRNIALTDNIAFPWFASAGYTRGIVNAIKARKKLTLDERDTLYVGRLNPIATFSDTGPIVWGNKTLQLKESALDRINVRRLLLQTRKLISAVAVRLIFEQNDDIVRQQFLDLVNPILDSIRRDRGLTDFRVVLSSDPEEIDRNEMSGKIYIKPTRALEYIFVEFLVTPTGASFEDV